jgi:hypothetical protein
VFDRLTAVQSDRGGKVVLRAPSPAVRLSLDLSAAQRTER